MNLALIGFMACGKSRQGRILARRLRMPLRDVDAIIERHAGCTVAELFERDGEAEFRRRERETIARVSSCARCVIATGGGAVLDPANVRALKAGGRIVLLTASVSEIVRRVEHRPDRPLLTGAEDVRTRVEGLLARREAAYRAAADFTVDTTGRPAEDVAEEIIRWFCGEEARNQGVGNRE